VREFAEVAFEQSGLLCRGGCDQAFHPPVDTVAGIGIAALERNDHEQTIHGYEHIAHDYGRPDWQNPVRRRKVRA
jgi:hypothetical protein